MVDIDWRKLLGMMVSFVVAVLICAVLHVCMGCTRRVYVPVETVKHDSVVTAKLVADTMMVRDSVYVREKGDTVWCYRWKTEYKSRWLTDTVIVERVDSLAVPYEVVKEKAYIPSMVWYLIGGLGLAVLGMGAWIRYRD